MEPERLPRRHALKIMGRLVAGVAVAGTLRPVKAAAQKMSRLGVFRRLGKTNNRESITRLAARGYDPEAHYWSMVIDVDKCIGCGRCVQACKTENKVLEEPFYFRTWVERYVITKTPPGSPEARGETVVDSPNGGHDGFPPSPVPAEDMLKSFFVPKLCNLCVSSPCTQVCPVGATFESPDGAVLVDPEYCIGCAFCVQACPYGCRFLNPVTRVAEKCTLCYHRITKGLLPACVEVCPTGARLFGDLKDPSPDTPIRKFIAKNKLGVLKPHLNTHPKVLYANLDKEVS